MEKQIFTKELFKNYVKTRNFSIKDHNGYYIQERNKFFISIDTKLYGQLIRKLINRRAVIIAEEKKTINKQFKEDRNFIFIDCLNRGCRKSIKAVFKRFDLTPRKKRVLDPSYLERERQAQRIRNEKKQSRN